MSFDHETDRLFSVGDLVDRGLQSKDCLDWLAAPWFFAVRGNHEQMAIDAADGLYETGSYIHNGGGWFLELSLPMRKLYADTFKEMPLHITVETPTGLVGIVHGDAPTDWDMRDKIHEHHALWGRQRHQRKDNSLVKNIDRVYCGHTPVKKPLTYGNVHFIDTGAVFGGPFTVERIT